MDNIFDIRHLGDSTEASEMEDLRSANALLKSQIQELRRRCSDYDIFNSTIQSGASKHIFDKKLTCYWANDYFYFMTGYTREQFSSELDSSIIRLINPDDVKNFLSELQYCTDCGIPNFHIDLRITHREGHILNFKTAVSIITDDDSGKVYFYCIYTDISTAVRNELTAKSQMRFLETLCNSMFMGICQYAVLPDGSLKFNYANATAYKVWECSREEFRMLYGSYMSNLTHSDDLDFVKDTIKVVIKEKSSATFEQRIVTKDGKIKWIYVNVRYALNQDGKESLLAEFKDISERHTLRVENDSILKNMPGFMAKYVFKDKPYLIEANDKFYNFYGTKFEDYANNALYKTIGTDITERIRESVPLIMERKPISFEFRAEKSDGNPAWIKLQASYIGEDEGCPVYLTIQVDITDVKALQFKLEEEKERYRIAYDNSACVLFEYDIADDRLSYWKRNTGSSDAAIQFDNCFRNGMIEQSTYADDVPIMKSFLLGNTDKKVETRRIRSEYGQSVLEWVEASGTTIYDVDNNPIKVIGTYRSISAQDNTIYDKIEKVIRADKDTSYAVIRMDIDNFKMINDLYGWDNGDKILSYIANLLKDVIHDDRYPFGRVTADIFCICVPYADKAALIRLIREIRIKIKEYPIDFNIVPHFGIYIAEPGCETPASVMFDRANLALKTVKEKVYSPMAFFDENLRDNILAEKRIERDMQAALDNGEFLTYFQPKYDISTSKIVGAEALVRWNHDNEILAPNSFIPLFERNGFIVSLDEYVWECVCKYLRKWIDSGYEIIPISVNVSRVHIFDPNFSGKLMELTEKYNIPPKMIVLEFTESVFLDDINELCRIMNELSNNGFKLSMDDFGSGFSSLNMLKTVPLNEVKIDKEFLNETVASKKGKTVVASTIFMVNQLEMAVIAEGVETAEQAEFLLAAGCDTAQGFFYSKPVPVEEFEQLAFGTKK